MRVHLSARAISESSDPNDSRTVLLTIRSAHWAPSRAEHHTTAPELVSILRRHTEIRAIEIERFRDKLNNRQDARLFHINLHDDALQRLGFFLD
jgi:hypothetical protein